MSLFSFFRLFKRNRAATQEPIPGEYIPLLWEDDYCQIELVPKENKAFIEMRRSALKAIVENQPSDNEPGKSFEGGTIPVPTISKEIRSDYFHKLLTDLSLRKADRFQYYNGTSVTCDVGDTSAYGFPGFTIFFEREDEFVRNLWCAPLFGISTREGDIVKNALYRLGVECELLLIDWNRLELVDLEDLRHVRKYVREHTEGR